jgi:hypothetical protein
VRKRELERRLKQQRDRRRQRDRERRIRRGALVGAEGMLRLAAERLIGANEPELLAHAQRVHQAARDVALSRKLRLAGQQGGDSEHPVRSPDRT